MRLWNPPALQLEIARSDKENKNIKINLSVKKITWRMCRLKHILNINLQGKKEKSEKSFNKAFYLQYT